MTSMTDRAGLKVAQPLASFIEDRALPGTGIGAAAFWQGAAAIFAQFAPENAALLAKRDAIQTQIDAWHQERAGQPLDAAAYQGFLRDIGYLVPEPAPFQIGSENVDDEVARLAGAQLVVPILNARFLLNAANARWGSLYDALYGTDAIPGAAAGRAMTRHAARRSSPGRRPSWTKPSRSPTAPGQTLPATTSNWPIPANILAGARRAGSSATTACISKSSSTARTPSARTTRRA